MATEIINERLLYPSYEIIGGEKFQLPSITPAQNQIKGRIMYTIGKHLVENKRGYFYGNVAVRFDDENIFIPDAVVVLKENEHILAQRDMVRGAPDMIVEVLSYSTRKKDLTIKKDTYEAQGVREYWIIDPQAKSVTVYLLRDGKYELDDVYILVDAEEFETLDDEDKAAIKHEVPVSIVDGLTIPLDFVFSWGY